jgi:hypothetical protein
MRKAILGLIVALGISSTAVAADILPAKPEIEGTIQSQIEAFLVDDFTTAFTFASPNIRSIFGSAERFGAMVQQGYPMVWRPSETRYLELRDIDGRIWQKVMIRDGQGGLHVLDYQMIQTAEGWKINGVQLLRAPDVGA